MAHWEQQEFVKQVRNHFPEFFKNKKVLEVGSGEIGGTIRPLFEGGEYLGVDVSPGPAVDRACPGQDLDEGSSSFNVVLSCECFEHNPFWLETFSNMLRMLSPGGLCVVSCALTGRTEHGTRRMDPQASLAESELYEDYYHNLCARDFKLRMNLDLHFECYFFHENIFHKDLYFVGIKRGGLFPEEQRRHVDDLHNAVSKIRREWTLTRSQVFFAHFKHALKVLLISVFGEQRFHDFKYSVRKSAKELAVAVIGNERYKERSQKRRARGRERKDILRSSNDI